MTFRVRQQSSYTTPIVQSSKKVQQTINESTEKNHQFKVHDDVVVYDKESGLWKIKTIENDEKEKN